MLKKLLQLCCNVANLRQSQVFSSKNGDRTFFGATKQSTGLFLPLLAAFSGDKRCFVSSPATIKTTDLPNGRSVVLVEMFITDSRKTQILSVVTHVSNPHIRQIFSSFVKYRYNHYFGGNYYEKVHY